MKKYILFVIIILGTLLILNKTAYGAFFFKEQLEHATLMGSTSFDWANDIVIDSQDNYYVVGIFNGTVDFDENNVVSGDTKTASASDIFIAKYNPEHLLIWVKALGSTLDDNGTTIGIDNNDNIYVGGAFRGTVDFDEDNVVAGDTHTNASGSVDIFIAKYNSNGVAQWVKDFGGTSPESISAINYISSNNTISVSGSFQAGPVDFDEDNVVSGDTHSSAGSYDFYNARYNATTGLLQWVNAPGSSAFDQLYNAAVDTSGNTYAVGVFAGTVDFEEDSVVSGDTLTNSGANDAFLAKYNSSGVLQWVKKIATVNDDYLYGVTVDSSDNVYVSGSYPSTIDLETSSVIPGDTLSGGGNAFYARYSSSGVFQFAKAWGNNDPLYGAWANDVLVDSGNYVNIIGAYGTGDPIDFEPNYVITGDTVSSLGSSDNYVARYTPEGMLSWVKTFGDVNDDGAYAFDLDSNNDVYLVGYINGGTVDFDKDYVISGDTHSSAGDYEIFIAKYVYSDIADEAFRIVLRDSENSNTTSDVEVWFNTTTNVTANTNIKITYDQSFTNGAALNTSDITVTCDPDGVDPVSGSAMTGVSVVSSENGYLELSTGVSTCGDYIVVDINGGGGQQLTNPQDPGNYSWSVSYDTNLDETPEAEGATLAYVQNENDVNVTAYVPPVLDLELYQTGTNTLLNGTGANTCALGVLSINTVSTCTYDIGTGTNNQSGVTITISSDGPLDDGSGNTIDACSGANCDDFGTDGVNAGEEEYGIYISELGGGEYEAAGAFDLEHQAVPTVDTPFATTDSTGSGTTTGSISQRLEVTHAASIATSTAQGGYNQVVTFKAYTN